jgi:hypothetical protein
MCNTLEPENNELVNGRWTGFKHCSVLHGATIKGTSHVAQHSRPTVTLHVNRTQGPMVATRDNASQVENDHCLLKQF